MSESTVVIRVDDELKIAFASAAKAADRTASQLLRDFMRDFVSRQSQQKEYEQWLQEKIDLSRKALQEGRVVDNEDVEAYFAERRAKSMR
ncbi:CopG family ribbon-helix-helix protein [Serratia liquefaciens]